MQADVSGLQERGSAEDDVVSFMHERDCWPDDYLEPIESYVREEKALKLVYEAAWNAERTEEHA